jgi:hypothetical protein
MALTSGGVRPGLACSISATVPATAGAAIEVPLIIISVSQVVLARAGGRDQRCGFSVASVFQVALLLEAASPRHRRCGCRAPPGRA